ncbi:MAG: 1-acyl-sn-glycerol-3-phosphate acyltransferase [Phycisphaeraceae bacterium]|nr:1-acyl-sn-glycerol-3-phosphate acyltransferase [Phycisphaeraceae bacterium]
MDPLPHCGRSAPRAARGVFRVSAIRDHTRATDGAAPCSFQPSVIPRLGRGRNRLYPRVATHLARAGLFKRRGFAYLITKFHAVPLREEEGDLGAMRLVIERLKLGDAVIIYPEGSRTHDGAIHAFKRGATLIAKRSGCTVLPVAIDGAFDIWPRSRSLPRLFRGPLRVLIGEPIAASDLLAAGADAGLARLENEVRQLHERLTRR